MKLFKRKNKNSTLIRDEILDIRGSNLIPTMINDKLGYFCEKNDKRYYIVLNGNAVNIEFNITVKKNGKVLFEEKFDENYMESLGFVVSRFPKEIRISKGFYSIKIKFKGNTAIRIPLHKNTEFVPNCLSL